MGSSNKIKIELTVEEAEVVEKVLLSEISDEDEFHGPLERAWTKMSMALERAKAEAHP